MTATPTPIEVAVGARELADLRDRLGHTRWAPELDNADWRYGTNGASLRELVGYWLEGYDWAAELERLNAFDHRSVEIDGVPLHHFRVTSKEPGAMPLLLVHGWPWTFWDFHRVIGPLTDPVAHGGAPGDAFDVVVVSLPGFGLSNPLSATGMNFWRTGDLLLTLMRDVLGYDRFAVHGGDWGAFITEHMGHKYADHVVGIHLTNTLDLSMWGREHPWVVERRRSASHVAVHVLDPQTLAWACHDSPVGLTSWLLERRRNWSDCDGDVERRFSKDFLITTTMLYWITDSFVNTVRYYAEATLHPWQPSHDRRPVVEVPTGITLFVPEGGALDGDRHANPWVHEYFDVHHLNLWPRGGHFAPMEEPDAVVSDIRATMRDLR